MIHELKILPEYFNAVIIGDKTFEIRLNDRNYQIGDDVILKEYSPEVGYTGREMTKTITYITEYAQRDNYVVFSVN